MEPTAWPGHRQGTNEFHGALFEYCRGTLFEANDFFNNRSGVPRTPLVRNTFSGAIGGPGARDTSRSGYGIRLDPAVRNLAPPTNWSNFTGIRGAPRVMQVGARFVF